MLWSKANPAQSSKENQTERNDEPEKLANNGDSVDDSVSDVAEYPGQRVVLLTVLSICLAVFLTALVSLISRLLRLEIECLITAIRIEPLLALQFPQYQIISTPSTTYLGTSPRTYSPSAPSNCPWARSMYVMLVFH